MRTFALNLQEIDFIRDYRALAPEQQAMILRLVHSMAQSKSPPVLPPNVVQLHKPAHS